MKFNDHDIHCHTRLSLCSGDGNMTYEKIVKHAEDCGYKAVCITDHFWDADNVPGASNWYKQQDLAHVLQNLPKPVSDKVKVYFGCETDYCGGEKLGISKACIDNFDFIIIPVNHFHMINFTRDEAYDTEEKIAELFVTRLEELIKISWLPWEKIGIAHLNCSLIFREGDHRKVLALADETRLRKVFTFLAEKGAGIELNSSCFFESGEPYTEEDLRLFRIAKECGCKFYCGSDAHHPEELDYPEAFDGVIEELGLTPADKFLIK